MIDSRMFVIFGLWCLLYVDGICCGQVTHYFSISGGCEDAHFSKNISSV